MATNWQASEPVLHLTSIGDKRCDPGGRKAEAATTTADTTLVFREGMEKFPSNKIHEAEEGREVGAHHPLKTLFFICPKYNNNNGSATAALAAWKKIKILVVVIAVVGVAVVGVASLTVGAGTCLLRETCGNRRATNTATMTTENIRIRALMGDDRGGMQAKRIAYVVDVNDSCARRHIVKRTKCILLTVLTFLPATRLYDVP